MSTLVTKKGMLRDIGERSVEFLSSKSDLREVGLKILARYKGNILDQINSEISRIGIYVFVWPVRGKKLLRNVPGLYFDTLEWFAEVGEDPTMNKSGCAAEYVAEMVALHMLNWDPLCYGLNPFYPPDDCITDSEDPDFNGCFVKLNSSGGVPPKPL